MSKLETLRILIRSLLINSYLINYPVPTAGIEPATSALWRPRSTAELRRRSLVDEWISDEFISAFPNQLINSSTN